MKRHIVLAVWAWPWLFFGMLPMKTTAQSSMTWIRRGDSLLTLSDYEGALRSYQNAVRSDSNACAAYWKLSRQWVLLGNELPKSPDQRLRYRQADTCASQAIRCDSGNIAGYLARASALDKLAYDEYGPSQTNLRIQMRQMIDRCLALDSNSAEAHFLMGLWQRDVAGTPWLPRTLSRLFGPGYPSGTLDGAAEHFQKAIASDPEEIGYYVELGKTLVLMEEWRSADSAFALAESRTAFHREDYRRQRDARHYREKIQNGQRAELKDEIE